MIHKPYYYSFFLRQSRTPHPTTQRQAPGLLQDTHQKKACSWCPRSHRVVAADIGSRGQRRWPGPARGPGRPSLGTKKPKTSQTGGEKDKRLRRRESITLRENGESHECSCESYFQNNCYHTRDRKKHSTGQTGEAIESRRPKTQPPTLTKTSGERAGEGVNKNLFGIQALARGR